MLKTLEIKNFKSVLHDKIELGRVNVFIGENGCGKSNILEALMFASVGETYQTIDTDILYTNGIRVSKPSLMLSSFRGKKQGEEVTVNLEFNDKTAVNSFFEPDDKDNILSKWYSGRSYDLLKSIEMLMDRLEVIENSTHKETRRHDNLSKGLQNSNKGRMKEGLPTNRNASSDSFDNKRLDDTPQELIISITKALKKFNTSDNKVLQNFIIYNLNTEALRGIPEFQKSKKGIYGETLDIIISELNKEELEELKEYLYTVSWAEDFFIDEQDKLAKEGYKLNFSKSLLYFRDRYMLKKNNVFSSENSNEGILHILFYLANIISTKTPKLFAVDNIETALNPHLCRHVMKEIGELAKKHEKQLLITTHNPAILDGMNLFDDEIRLFEVFRTDNGDTKTRRIKLKPEVEGQQLKLSELWTRGHLGAISENF